MSDRFYYSTDKSTYYITIGLEIHAQLNTKYKLFSSSIVEDDVGNSIPNSTIDLFDLSYPGTLPVLNEEVIDKSIAFGLAINSDVKQYSRFDRKGYFYPDLASGYQITQFYHPIIENGFIELKLNNYTKKIGIERAHLEQDAGKLIHDKYPKYSCVDFNRAGTPLLEIVSKPDIYNKHEAIEYLKKIKILLKYVNASDCDMENGSFRCDVNISLSKDIDSLGTRCEIKNLNSFKFIESAIDYEIKRQAKILDNNLKIDQETRSFDVSSLTTSTLRKKEESDDYSYFPDPDLIPLIIDKKRIEHVKAKLPIMPDKVFEKYTKEYGISDKDAALISNNLDYVKYFDALLEKHDAKLSLTWFIGELFARLNKKFITFEQNPIDSGKMIELLDFIKSEVINGKIAKDVLDDMFDSNKRPKEIISEKGLEQVDDFELIKTIVDTVIKNNQSQYTEYKNGKQKLFGFFVGQVMKESKGKANPDTVNKILKEALK